MLTNEKPSQRTKHIDTKYHFVKDIYKQHQIDIKYCSANNMVADILTKPLGPIKLAKFAHDIGLITRH